MSRKLYRSNRSKMIAGVCGGLADYLDLDPTIVRLLWAAAIFIGGTGLLLYFICWAIIPQDNIY